MLKTENILGDIYKWITLMIFSRNLTKKRRGKKRKKDMLTLIFSYFFSVSKVMIFVVLIIGGARSPKSKNGQGLSKFKKMGSSFMAEVSRRGTDIQREGKKQHVSRQRLHEPGSNLR